MAAGEKEKMTLAHDNFFSLNAKVSLVTGAARGIGRSMAIGLAEAGSDLMLVDVLEDRIKQTSEEVSKKTGFFVTDLTASVWETKEKREWIESRIPLGRPGTPDDIVETIVYLVSPASDYLTGRVIFLDGGWMAS